MTYTGVSSDRWSNGLVMSSLPHPVTRQAVPLGLARSPPSGSPPGPLQQLGARVIAGRGLAEGLQGLPGLVVQPGRDHHIPGDQQVAAEPVRAAADALAPDPERAPVPA